MAASREPVPGQHRLDSLEGLRFLSSIAIVAGHYIPYVVSTPLIGRLHLAVDLFFVISGIVIAERYAGRITGTADYLQFMSRRVARLYPLHLATLAFYVAIGMLVWSGKLNPVDAARYNPQAILPNLLMVHAWLPAGVISFNYVSWSISAEFFVYICFPAILWALRRSPLLSLAGVVMLTVVLALVAERLTGKPLTKLSWEAGILRALPSFGFGVWTSCHADWLAARLRFTALPLAVAALLFAVAVLMLLRVDELLLLGLVWLLVAAAFLCDRVDRATLVSTPWLAARGELTYSIYMLHTVVATIVLAVAVPRLLGSGLPARIAGVLVALVLLYALARLSLRYFERPLRRRINSAADAALGPRLRRGLLRQD